MYNFEGIWQFQFDNSQVPLNALPIVSIVGLSGRNADQWKFEIYIYSSV